MPLNLDSNMNKKQQAIMATKLELEKAKSQFEIQKLREEAAVKKELMAEEFSYSMELAKAQAEVQGNKIRTMEDRKDERTKIQASQQSALIDQRKNDTLPKNFESANLDVLGGFGLGQYEPS